MSGGDAGAELPEAPRVGGELGLQVGGLPGAATIPTELDAADAAGNPRSGGAGLNPPRPPPGTIPKAGHAWHSLVHCSPLPTPVFPVARLIARGKSRPRHPPC